MLFTSSFLLDNIKLNFFDCQLFMWLIHLTVLFIFSQLHMDWPLGETVKRLWPRLNLLHPQAAASAAPLSSSPTLIDGVDNNKPFGLIYF